MDVSCLKYFVVINSPIDQSRALCHTTKKIMELLEIIDRGKEQTIQ